MGDAIAEVLGWVVLIGGAGWLTYALLRRATAHGILAPVAVGMGVRLAVLAIAHAGSLSLGDDGFFFLDDQTYMSDARRLAELWSAGSFPNPTDVEVLGTYQAGYQLVLGALFAFGTPSPLVGKLANVLIGGATVYLVARIAQNVLGERAQRRAAWLAALAPTLVWWSAPLLKEALVMMTLALGVLAVTTLPRRRSIATLAAALALLMLLRVPAALALIVGTGAALAIAGRAVEGRRLPRALVVFAGTLTAALLLVVTVTSGGRVDLLLDQYGSTARRMADLYQGSSLLRAPYDAVKSLVTPLPWVFDSGTRNWGRALYPGVWLLICAYPLAALGGWRLRRRPEAALLVATTLTLLATNAVTTGAAFRQRSTVEPLVLILAVAAASSWHMVGRYAAAALAVTAVVAGAQSGSPIVALSIAAVAATVFVITRRLPDQPLDPLPESPLIAGLRAGAGRHPPRADPSA